MVNESQAHIAIIGTGLSALSLAHHLPTLDVTFFEKSWRPGGRLSTRKQSDLEPELYEKPECKSRAEE